MRQLGSTLHQCSSIRQHVRSVSTGSNCKDSLVCSGTIPICTQGTRRLRVACCSCLSCVTSYSINNLITSKLDFRAVYKVIKCTNGISTAYNGPPRIYLRKLRHLRCHKCSSTKITLITSNVKRTIIHGGTKELTGLIRDIRHGPVPPTATTAKRAD